MGSRNTPLSWAGDPLSEHLRDPDIVPWVTRRSPDVGRARGWRQSLSRARWWDSPVGLLDPFRLGSLTLTTGLFSAQHPPPPKTPGHLGWPDVSLQALGTACLLGGRASPYLVTGGPRLLEGCSSCCCWTFLSVWELFHGRDSYCGGEEKSCSPRDSPNSFVAPGHLPSGGRSVPSQG